MAAAGAILGFLGGLSQGFVDARQEKLRQQRIQNETDRLNAFLDLTSSRIEANTRALEQGDRGLAIKEAEFFQGAADNLQGELQETLTRQEFDPGLSGFDPSGMQSTIVGLRRQAMERIGIDGLPTETEQGGPRRNALGGLVPPLLRESRDSSAAGSTPFIPSTSTQPGKSSSSKSSDAFPPAAGGPFTVPLDKTNRLLAPHGYRANSQGKIVARSEGELLNIQDTLEKISRELPEGGMLGVTPVLLSDEIAEETISADQALKQSERNINFELQRSGSKVKVENVPLIQEEAVGGKVIEREIPRQLFTGLEDVGPNEIPSLVTGLAKNLVTLRDAQDFDGVQGILTAVATQVAPVIENQLPAMAQAGLVDEMESGTDYVINQFGPLTIEEQADLSLVFNAAQGIHASGELRQTQIRSLRPPTDDEVMSQFQPALREAMKMVPKPEPRFRKGGGLDFPDRSEIQESIAQRVELLGRLVVGLGSDLSVDDKARIRNFFRSPSTRRFFVQESVGGKVDPTLSNLLNAIIGSETPSRESFLFSVPRK